MSDDAKVAMHPTAAVVRRSVTVEADQQRAFDVFTAGIDSWWNREHHLGDLPMKEIIIEPSVGGRCYTTQTDGKEFDWATVLAWEPPQRMVLGWHLNEQWQCDKEFVTEVEVTFRAEGPGRTHVTLEHRDLERFGAAKDEMAASLGGDGGWTGLLRLYADVVEKGA
jgi:uncharacterized protein YndB with AHSA1/START domain